MNKQREISPKKILIIFTGGTICSFLNKNGEQHSDTEKAEALIVHNFRNGQSKYKSENDVVFYIEKPLDVLSENMTVQMWQVLLDKIKTYDFSLYDGVIILHGTDTLAYTASLLSILLSGIKIPVFLVSSQLPLYNEAANGNANFQCAVEMTVDGITPNIYAVYRNEENIGENAVNTMYIHYASQLRQCENHSNNFYSDGMCHVDKFKGKPSQNREMMIYKCGVLSNCVLKLVPFVGLDYSRLSFDGVKVVLHHTYHSGTVAVDTSVIPNETDYNANSVMYLKKLCDEKGIELYIEPCDKNKAYLYETTGTLLKSGVGTSFRTTSEMAYVKLLIGCALGYSGEKLQAFIDCEINGEFIR